MLSVLIRIAPMGAILMGAHNMQFHDEIRKIPYIFVFFRYQKNYVGTQNEFKLPIVNEPWVFELLRFDCLPKQLINVYLDC